MSTVAIMPGFRYTILDKINVDLPRVFFIYYSLGLFCCGGWRGILLFYTGPTHKAIFRKSGPVVKNCAGQSPPKVCHCPVLWPRGDADKRFLRWIVNPFPQDQPDGRSCRSINSLLGAAVTQRLFPFRWWVRTSWPNNIKDMPVLVSIFPRWYSFGIQCP